MYVFIDYLKSIAALLIANSHFKGIYPNDIFSFGGGFGLSIFYIVSGYLLSNINKETKFYKWYLKRLLRIYIPLLLFYLVSLLIMHKFSISYLLKCVIFPGNWFCNSMIVMYLLYYFFVKYIYNKYGNKSIYILLSILFAIYSMLYIFKPQIATFSLEGLKFVDSFTIETPYFITQFGWFSCMLLGLLIRKEDITCNTRFNLVFILASVILFFGIKMTIKMNILSFLSYFLVLVYVFFGYSMFVYFKSKEQLLNQKCKTVLYKIVKIISSCTIEILYTQFIWINIAKDIVFPLNLLFLVVSISISSYILHKISDFIYKPIAKRLS